MINVIIVRGGDEGGGGGGRGEQSIVMRGRGARGKGGEGGRITTDRQEVEGRTVKSSHRAGMCAKKPSHAVERRQAGRQVRERDAPLAVEAPAGGKLVPKRQPLLLDQHLFICV